MVYATEAQIESRVNFAFEATTNPTSTQLGDWITDASAVINAYLGITSDTTDTMVLARVLPIMKRMISMQFQLYRAETLQDPSTVLAIYQSLAGMGISQPLQLTKIEKLDLDDVFQDVASTEGKKHVAGVWNTRTGNRVYTP